MSFRPIRVLPPAGQLLGAFGAARVVIGTAALAAPVLSLRVLGVDTGSARRVAWLMRMTGARDAVLGAGALAGADGRQQAAWALGGAVVDAADAAIMYGALRSGRLGGVVPAAVAAGAAGAALLGAVEALRLRG
ncbi:MAG TPA: hypothetical protein VFH38_04560 [Jatrophihabitans sp.]|nr:hypothetical protein [Jatrophihabitans sp.]